MKVNKMITTYKQFLITKKSKLLSEQTTNENEQYILPFTILEFLMLLFYEKVHFNEEIVFYSLTDKSNSPKAFIPSIENNNKTVIIYFNEIPDSLNPSKPEELENTEEADQEILNVPINKQQLSLTELKPKIKRVEISKMFISQVNGDDEIGLVAVQTFFEKLKGKLTSNQWDTIKSATSREQLVDIVKDILTRKQSGYIISYV